MRIEYHNNFYRKQIEFEDSDFKGIVDVEYRKWEKDESGKTVCTVRDVDDDAMYQVSKCLENMANSRVREFDSSECIMQLFDKLPADVKRRLVSELSSEIED